MQPLSGKEQRVLDFISGYIASNGCAPTIAEIGRFFQLSSSATVHQILVKLESQGVITRTPNISRGISLVPQPAPMVGWLDR
jgi:repressor LexA